MFERKPGHEQWVDGPAQNAQSKACLNLPTFGKLGNGIARCFSVNLTATLGLLLPVFCFQPFLHIECYYHAPRSKWLLAQALNDIKRSAG
jgi:hypothetical protein